MTTGEKMQVIEKLVVSDRALAVIRNELARLGPRKDDVMVLSYMSSFINADGTTVSEFAPGYTIGFEPAPQIGDFDARAYLPDGRELQFMPMSKLEPSRTYVLDRASGYTLSIELQAR